MRALSNILLVLNLQSSTKTNPRGSSVGILEGFPSFFPKSGVQRLEERNVLVNELLDEASKVGQVGSLASDEERARLSSLAEKLAPYSDPSPAMIPLDGIHRLVYSAAPGASSGRIAGNIVGKVSQKFETSESFYNRVTFGPLMIALQAKREIKNASTIKVSFLETSFSLFGQTFCTKKAGGGGVWKVKFVGKIQGKDGKEKLVRVMETPSLFILEQELN
jgi:hypothetical protein